MRVIVMFFVVFFNVSLVLSQIEATTRNGEKVLLNNDSTWKYLEESIKKSEVSFECEDLITVENDKITGVSTIMSTENIVVSEDGGKTGFGILMYNTDYSLVVKVVVVGASNCIDNKNKMYLLFRDGSRLELSNNGKYNCKGEFTLYFKGNWGKKKQLEMLKTKEIEAMRISAFNGFVEQDFNETQSKQFLETVKCLANQL